MSFWKKLGAACADIATARRSIPGMFTTYRTIRVAVVGGRNCGKTVFLTSLANHLRNHRSTVFPLKGGLSVHWDQRAITGDKLYDLPLFNYNAARWNLTQGKWPPKTVDTTILALRLLLNDTVHGGQEQVQLEVLDLPGERIADFAMMGKSYKEWCKWRDETLSGPNGTSPNYQHYLNAIENIGANNEAMLIDAYRDFMAYEYGHFAPDITPSTVKLGLGGERRDGVSPDEFREAIGKVPMGFTDVDGKVCEFVPLPVSCFDKTSPFYPLAKKFGHSYDRYVKRVVRPMEKWLGKAQKLIYLVDVLTLLRSGANAWDAEKQNAEAAIGALCPHAGNVFGRMWRWTKGVFWRTQINSVYVVATKSDLVVGDVNRNNMKELARRLVDNTLPFLAQEIKRDTVTCAAVCSTEEVEGEDEGEVGLRGMLEMAEGASPELASWIPPPVPTDLPISPDDWKAKIEAGVFDYHKAFPAFGTAESCPPTHLGLNVLVNEMLSK